MNFAQWRLTAALNSAAYVLLPRWRPISRLLLGVHAAILVRGVCSLRSRFFCHTLYRKQTNSREIALTFDDGPEPRLTEALLDLLAHHDVKATFFVIAEKAAAYPHILQRAYNEGHVIGCHDLNHAIVANFRLYRTARKEIGKARELIRACIGKTPALYRPPVGLMNPHIARAVRFHTMHCIGWSASGWDRGNRSLSGIERIPSLAHAGGVILLHDSLGQAAYRDVFLCRVNRLLESIRRQKLATKTVDAFFNIPAYATTRPIKRVNGAKSSRHSSDAVMNLY